VMLLDIFKVIIERMRNMKQWYVILTMLSTCVFAGSSLKKKLDSYVRDYVDEELFSGVILVAKDGNIILSKSYGMSNYELSVPNTIDTKFRIGSITKTFTAMAIMQLQDKGLLDIQDPLSKYISDYPYGDTITIQHLLNHTSGIPYGDVDYKNNKIRPHTLEKRIELFKHLPLIFKPGEGEGYSDSGYILLAYIIERVSGKSYESFLREYIFDSFDMNSSGYDSHDTIIKNRAAGYTFDGALKNAEYIDMSYESGAGALFSTVPDLYRWHQALSSEKLVPSQALTMSFGWSAQETGAGGYKWGTHAGLVPGFISFFGRYVNNDACIILLSNFAHTPLLKMVYNLEKILFDKTPEKLKKHVVSIVKPDNYDQYVGTYVSDNEKTYHVTQENGRLFVEEVGDSIFEVLPESETEFFIKGFDASYEFVKNEDGDVVQLIEQVSLSKTSAFKV
jgi:CubicO group peptidase (beta-lactamase class C family)